MTPAAGADAAADADGVLRALAEPQRERCSLPGEAEAIQLPIMTSNSNFWRRR